MPAQAFARYRRAFQRPARRLRPRRRITVAIPTASSMAVKATPAPTPASSHLNAFDAGADTDVAAALPKTPLCGVPFWPAECSMINGIGAVLPLSGGVLTGRVLGDQLNGHVALRRRCGQRGECDREREGFRQRDCSWREHPSFPFLYDWNARYERGSMGASAELPYSSCGACDDDEPGSPWTIVLYVDERGSDEQRERLAEILLGER